MQISLRFQGLSEISREDVDQTLCPRKVDNVLGLCMKRSLLMIHSIVPVAGSRDLCSIHLTMAGV